MNVNNISKERFLKAKKTITKKYPGAKTLIDPEGKYYVATADGRDICNLQVSRAMNGYTFNQTENCNTDYELDKFNTMLDQVCQIPHSDSVKAAWMTTEVAIKSYRAVERNTNKFSDEKVTKKMAKDFE
jgi:hypothetical protein